eukprot:g1205.t1
MLSVVSSRLEGSNCTFRNGVSSWNKTTKPCFVSANGCVSKLPQRFNRKGFPTSVRRKLAFSVYAQSDITQNLEAEDDAQDSKQDDASSETDQVQTPSSESEDPKNKFPQAKLKSQSITSLPFRMGDRVTITVSGLRRMGAVVDIEQHPGYKGYLPVNNFPVTLLPEKYMEIEQAPSRTIYNHLKRNAIITSVSAGKAEFASSPIMNAYRLDKDVLFRRLFTLKRLCMDEKLTFKGYIYGRNKAGMVVAIAGFPCFLPRSLMTDADIEMHSAPDEVFGPQFLGNELEVMITDIETDRNRTIVSTKQVEDVKTLRSLKIGQLISGRIQGFAPYGAFITIDGTSKTGLLHVRNISGKIVRSADVSLDNSTPDYLLLAEYFQSWGSNQGIDIGHESRFQQDCSQYSRSGVL